MERASTEMIAELIDWSLKEKDLKATVQVVPGGVCVSYEGSDSKPMEEFFQLEKVDDPPPSGFCCVGGDSEFWDDLFADPVRQKLMTLRMFLEHFGYSKKVVQENIDHLREELGQ